MIHFLTNYSSDPRRFIRSRESWESALKRPDIPGTGMSMKLPRLVCPRCEQPVSHVSEHYRDFADGSCQYVCDAPQPFGRGLADEVKRSRRAFGWVLLFAAVCAVVGFGLVVVVRGRMGR